MTRELATISVETGEITKLEKHKFSEYGLWDWLPDGKGFIVLAREKREENNSFWQISFPSAEARKLTNDLSRYPSMSFAPDANILATVQNAVTSNIWIVPVGDPARATQVTTGSNYNSAPRWTQDGNLIYFRSLGDNSDIYEIDPRGGNPKLLASNILNEPAIISPDE